MTVIITTGELLFVYLDRFILKFGFMSVIFSFFLSNISFLFVFVNFFFVISEKRSFDVYRYLSESSYLDWIKNWNSADYVRIRLFLLLCCVILLYMIYCRVQLKGIRIQLWFVILFFLLQCYFAFFLKILRIRKGVRY